MVLFYFFQVSSFFFCQCLQVFSNILRSSSILSISIILISNRPLLLRMRNSQFSASFKIQFISTRALKKKSEFILHATTKTRDPIYPMNRLPTGRREVLQLYRDILKSCRKFQFPNEQGELW